MALADLEHIRSGKVRDLYAIDDDTLLLVASDRVSTFDVVHPTPVPNKGRVLTALSAFWFAHVDRLMPNHLLSTSLADLPEHLLTDADFLRGRFMLCKTVDIIPFECVVRGYLAGSGWSEYQAGGAVCGVALPDGLSEAAQLPEPIFTPATKNEAGTHDENVPFSVMVDTLGEELANTMKRQAVALYNAGAKHAATRGIILADTKFEFGVRDGQLVLADEVMTPDSSRYWPKDKWQPGTTPPSFDKQFVRDFAQTTGWDKRPPAPALPDDVVAHTAASYVAVYEQLTEQPFSVWLNQP
jgi:phosphoribosylaminoimidazole-succinocarboxamide synthase